MIIPAAVKEMAGENLVVQVVTSDKSGTPHIAAARGFRVIDDEHVAFEDWFCFQTLKNLGENPKIALSVMRPGDDGGYQLIGTVERTAETEVLDGYIPDEREHGAIPQIKHQLQIKVEKILKLSTGPHSNDL